METERAPILDWTTALPQPFAASALRSAGEPTYADEVLPPSAPQKGLPFVLDVIEICGGFAVISYEASSIGLRVGPPIDISTSRHFNVLDPDFAVWLYGALKAGHVRALALKPPCTFLQRCPPMPPHLHPAGGP